MRAMGWIMIAIAAFLAVIEKNDIAMTCIICATVWFAAGEIESKIDSLIK